MTRIPSPPRPTPTSVPDGAWTRPSPPPAVPATHRQPEPPPGLEQFEHRVMGSDWPPFAYADRATLRMLLRYVRRLERYVGKGDSGECSVPASRW